MKNDKLVKHVVITGGHATPALALAQVLAKKGWKISWIGTGRAFQAKGGDTLEKQIIPQEGISFFEIDPPKLQRKNLVKSLLLSFKFLLTLQKTIKYLKKVKPHIVVSFGSFVAVPPVIAAKFLKIPTVTHEQTAASGLANRFIGKLVDKVAISFPESRQYFPKKKVVLTGNPVRASMFKLKQKRQKTPLIYITGGSRGSQVINTAVWGVLTELLEISNIYHQTGSLDFFAAKQVKKTLPQNLSRRYHIEPTIFLREVEKIYQKATLVISRAGANTVSELAILGLPAILIPIPWSWLNEQEKNAMLVKKAGTAEIISQGELTPQLLLKTIKTMLKNIKQYKNNAFKAQKLIPENAAERLAKLVENVAKV